MTTAVQAMLGVEDVARSAAWYGALLACTNEHDGDDFARLVQDGQTLLLLHRRGAPEHASLRDFDGTEPGRGVVLWFMVDDFDGVWARAQRLGAGVLDPPHANAEAGHRELTVVDPDGYVVAVCGAL